MIKNIIDITDLSFGGKAYGLNKLNRLNVKVPQAYAINQEFINKVIDGDKKSIEKLNEVLSKFNKNTMFAIRSSASNEDGNVKSFAGMYESILNVQNNIEKIIEAIKKVNNSLASIRVDSYDNEKSKMNIVLQEMIQPKVAGVCFTDAIDLDGSDSFYIEYVEGLGETLVSGKKTAKYVVVSQEDYSYRCEEEKDRLLFANLINDLKKIKSKTPEELDMEWCINESGEAYFVQARPITRKIIIREKLSTGAIASPGYCSGIIYTIDEDIDDDEIIEQKIKDFPTGAILLAKTTDTNYVPAMKKASGIITTEGSVLSHAAIIAREFAIPCITGYKSAFSIFKDGKIATIDTNNKSITYNGNKISFGAGKEINLLELYNFNDIIEERIDENLILVESVDDEFGIHIDDDLEQDEINKIEIFIRKKYKRCPVILKDQKFLWYTEFKRYKKFPKYEEKCKEALNICYSFDVNRLNNFVCEILKEMKSVYNSCVTEYDYVYSGEYAQALHFLINLYMCNGCAMRAIYDYIKINNISSVQQLLNTNSIQGNFLRRIESVRASIWEIFVKNGWSSDDYYNYREEKISSVVGKAKNSNDAIDKFYNDLGIQEYKKKQKK